MGERLPNLEDPRDLISSAGDRPTPACFGYVAPGWEPRLSFAGTYDEAWQSQRAPFLPFDFDSRFFNAASADLVWDGYLTGGEPVELVNLSPRGPLRFHLPVCRIDCNGRVGGRSFALQLNIETVLFEPDESRVSILWRGAHPCGKHSLAVEEVELGLSELLVDGMAA